MIDIVKKSVVLSLGPDAGKTAWYAAFSRKGTSNSIDIARQMKEGSSAFTLGEVVGITLDLPSRIKQALLNGQAVTIDGLGTFKPSLSTAIQSDKDALKTSHVSIRSVNFTPDRSFIAELNAQAKFDWINSDRASTEDDGTTDAPTDGQTGNPPTSDPSSSGNQPSGNNGASDIPDDVVFPGT